MADVYDKEKRLTSLHIIPHHLLRTDMLEEDSLVERNKDSVQFAMSHLPQADLELIFFKYFHGDSFWTLKKTLNIGSTKTIAKRLKRLEYALRVYIEYFNNGFVYEDDLKKITDKLGPDICSVADRLFKRSSYVGIMREDDIKRKKLIHMIEKIELLCVTNDITGFWSTVCRLRSYKL